MTMDKIDAKTEAAEDRGGDADSVVDRNHFPSRLHMMLHALENSPEGSGIGWQPHGKVFIIRNTGVFVDQVLPT